MKNPLISVIIPVYKTEDYLKHCIDSVRKQTYRNLEIILVDDGSPDHCPQICDDYARKDARIKVIHKENGGLSSARNTGLDICRGEYLAFVDSDDYVHPQYLEILYKILKKYHADISVCGVSAVHSNTGTEQFRRIRQAYVTQMLPQSEIIPIFEINMVVACNKLYKSQLFSILRFPEGKFCEDTYTTYQTLLSSKVLAVTDARLYQYYQHPKSIMHQRDDLSDYIIESLRQTGEYCINHIHAEQKLNQYLHTIAQLSVDAVLDDYWRAWKLHDTARMKETESLYHSFVQGHQKKLKFRLFETNRHLFLLAMDCYEFMKYL